MNMLFSALMTGVMSVSGLIGVPADQGAEETENPVTTPVQEQIPEQDVSPADGGNARVVTVTAYTSEPRQTDSTPCISSDGTDICQRYAAGELICAAGDRNVPLGSKFYVEGYGTCTVADRMNIRYNGTGRVDIYLGHDTPSAYEWGLRKVAVTRIQ